MEYQAPDLNLWCVLPTLLVAVTALVVLLRGLFVAPERRRLLTGAQLGLGAAAVATVLALLFRGVTSFGGMLLVDRPTALFYLVFLLVTSLSLVLTAGHPVDETTERCEVAALLLLGCLGMMLMASAGHLLMLFLGLEMMSVSLYILAGLAGARERASTEAALKYLLLGAFASGFLVYGLAYLYGGAATLDLGGVARAIGAGTIRPGFVQTGLALITIGLGFKVALVPFHMWAPDVYEGAPTAITAYMAAGAKVAGFAALVRVFDQAALGLQETWLPAFWWLAVVTMFVGNIVALAQTSVKRMLAYSSVAHAGYLTVGVLAGSRLGVQAVLFYALAYALMTVGAFAVVLAVGDREGRLPLDGLRGLARREPFLAGAMAVFMFALAGVPPLSGFLGKWLLFAAAVEQGQVLLAVLGVLASAISAFYYLRVVVLIYMSEPAGEPVASACPPRTRQVLGVCLAGTLVASFPLGLFLVALAGWGAGGY